VRSEWLIARIHARRKRYLAICGKTVSYCSNNIVAGWSGIAFVWFSGVQSAIGRQYMSKKLTTPPSDRFSIRLDGTFRAKVQSVLSLSGASTEGEAVRNAITVYHSLLSSAERGVQFRFCDRKSGEEGSVWIIPGPAPFEKH